MSNSSPVSDKRAEASRTNGAKSSGPKTEEGKAKSSRNSLKHGLYGAVKTMLATDDCAEFEGFHRELYEQFAPTDPYQIVLAEKIIGCIWRRGAFEDILSRLLQVKSKTDGDVDSVFKYNQRAIESVFRILRGLDRTVDSARRELENLQSVEKEKTQERTRELDPRPACDLVERMIAERKADPDRRIFKSSDERHMILNTEQFVAEAITGTEFETENEITDELLSATLQKAMENPESELGIILNKTKQKYPELAEEQDPLKVLEKLNGDEPLLEELGHMI